MSHRRLSRIALALAPMLALMACDQVSSWFGKGESGPGPAALSDVPLDARAVSGVVHPPSEAQGLLSAEPLLVAPGEIVVGARVQQELAETAAEMGLASTLVRSLAADGEGALNQLPQAVMMQLRARAEAEAGDAARDAARLVLTRLGVPDAQVNVRPGGVVTVNISALGVSPTAFHGAQATGAEAAQAAAEPTAIAWNPSESCPRTVSQGQLEADVALATRCAIARLTASRQFEYVEPNFVATLDFDRLPFGKARETPASTTAPSQGGASNTAPATPAQIGGIPNDPLLALQWPFKPRGSGPGQAPGGAGFEAFWEAHQIGSRQVRVAVIDTGLDMSHPEIHNSPNVGQGVDLITSYDRAGDTDGVDADPNDAGDKCGTATENSYHGTHVSGTIGAATTNDRIGISGGAWNVTVIPVRVLGKCGGELADIVSGIRWAAALAPAVTEGGAQIANAAPADIINMSLSIKTPCPASMQAAIDAAYARGTVIVVAAGNKSDNANLYAPANCNHVITVAASDEMGVMSFYSNFGPAVDIMAPGGDVYADNDHDGRPDGVLSTRTSTTSCYDPIDNGATNRTCYYTFLQGTSMAAPHVAAALALLASQTGLRGPALEQALFARAITPLTPAQTVTTCARFPNAIPISAQPGQCDRPGGLGILDLARAATTIQGGAAITTTQRRRR